MPLVVSEGPAPERKNPVQNEPDDSGPGAYMGGFWEKQPESRQMQLIPGNPAGSCELSFEIHHAANRAISLALFNRSSTSPGVLVAVP